MGCLGVCLKKHYWQFEIGLRPVHEALPLRFGSAWARAMETRWKTPGSTYDDMLASALPEGVDLDPYTSAMLSALLAGYIIYWGKRETFMKIFPEVPFERKLDDVFSVAGVLDGLGQLKNHKLGIVEYKSTSAKIDDASDYWRRLYFNIQILQYVDAARNFDEPWDVEEVVYDVTKKCRLKPKLIPILDEDNTKIVEDTKGRRVKNKDGKSWRQTASKEHGYVLKTRTETPDEYYDRCFADVRERPGFYFVRKEVPILEDVLTEFYTHREACAELIEHQRSIQGDFERPDQAWPRTGLSGMDTCKYCCYSSFCLQNIAVDPSRPPVGFEVRPFNPELERTSHAPAEEYDPDEEDNTPAPTA